MERVSRPSSALIIIDVQNDFCPGGRLEVRDGDAVVPVINAIAPRFGLVVATQDWHPAGHVSFASSHAGKRPLETIVAAGIEQVLWPDHCVQGTPGAALHDGLDLRPVRLILRKGCAAGLDSYSAFFENDHRTPTGLEPYLRALGFSELAVCGLATDYCVLYSAIDAARLGFSTSVVVDACRGVDAPTGSVARALETLERAGVRLTSSSEL